jgi:hypothetical protein
VIIEPIQTIPLPAIEPAKGNRLTESVFTATDVPQTLTTVYRILSLPAVKPVTILPTIVALELVLDHVPPVTVSVKVIEVPRHMMLLPEMTPAIGSGLTVTTVETAAVPQELTTVNEITD